ncbi:DUF2884 family protein [Microbulbifer yueqingensis]|uniref:DUF2884 family protein n=1 Tax=Microbulbifer yueqingensis TaxID=658219 RepID=A0A1G9DLV3_9GAMM|nr:DUF2884 family protein [Microbulbifer yueqingensis]SDK64851.1 Protein of unknown function [Microbulbifer yueqingensis]
MLKPLTFFAALTLAGQASASEVNLNISGDEQCNADLHYHVQVGPDFFQTFAEPGDEEALLIFRAPDKLLVEDQPVNVSEEQALLLQRYHRELYGASRELTMISLEAVDVALTGVSVTLAALAGQDHPDFNELQQTSAEIRARAEQRFDAEGNVFVFGEHGVGEFIEETIGEELEPRIEEIAMDSAGSIVWHAFKAVFTGGRSIERNAEKLAEQVEKDVEARAEGLEARAEKFCQDVAALDETERELHDSVPALSGYDLVTLKD